MIQYYFYKIKRFPKKGLMETVTCSNRCSGIDALQKKSKIKIFLTYHIEQNGAENLILNKIIEGKLRRPKSNIGGGGGVIKIDEISKEELKRRIGCK